MSAAFTHQVALALRAPWQWMGNDGSRSALWWYLGSTLLLAGAATVAALLWLPRGAWQMLASLLGVVGLVAVWGVQFSALLRLDHPHLARFAVGHGRALRAAALALWLVMVVFVSLVAALALEGLGGALNRMLLAALGAGALLLYTALALRWWALWFVVWPPLALVDQPLVLAALRPAASFARGLWHDRPLLGSLLVLLAMAIVLVNLFGRADPAHARAYARRERFRRIAAAGAAGQKPALSAYGRWGEVLGAPFQHLADAWLAHLIRRASAQRGSVMARAEVVLLGSQHWLRQLIGLVLVLLIVALGLVWLALAQRGGLAMALERGHVGMSIGLSSAATATLISLRGALWGSRREQALLMLLPGMPQGTALNQALVRQRVRHYLLIWVATLPAFAALAHGAHAPQVWGFAGALLPLAALLGDDASRLRQPSPGTGLWIYVLVLSLGMLFLLMLRWQPDLLLPWALGLVVLTVALWAWRWRLLSRWPQALPAGRLA